eukprot:224694-Chlamydomonas_euryale.AAC.3
MIARNPGTNSDRVDNEWGGQQRTCHQAQLMARGGGPIATQEGVRNAGSPCAISAPAQWACPAQITLNRCLQAGSQHEDNHNKLQ